MDELIIYKLEYPTIDPNVIYHVKDLHDMGYFIFTDSTLDFEDVQELFGDYLMPVCIKNYKDIYSATENLCNVWTAKMSIIYRSVDKSSVVSAFRRCYFGLHGVYPPVTKYISLDSSFVGVLRANGVPEIVPAYLEKDTQLYAVLI